MTEIILSILLGNLTAMFILMTPTLCCFYALHRVLRIEADDRVRRLHAKFYPIFDKALAYSTTLCATERKELFHAIARRRAFNVFINSRVLVGLHEFTRVSNPPSTEDGLWRLLRECDNRHAYMHIEFSGDDVIIILRQSGNILKQIKVTDPLLDLGLSAIKVINEGEA